MLGELLVLLVVAGIAIGAGALVAAIGIMLTL
jgi:hypothetical protein